NGTLVLFRDVLHDRSPVTLTFNDLHGTAYRIFSARGNIFVLASNGLYVFQGLAKRFVDGQTITHGPTPVRFIRLEAVDANLCEDRWLLVVMPDSVLRLDTDLLFAESSEAELAGMEEQRPFVATPVSPDWECRLDATNLVAIS
ncbi:MAG TPA: hypothetical protein PK867_03940, partial [Pirellulales bacterium]|nr:hypothetical protein [Pirellulales bacterium]